MAAFLKRALSSVMRAREPKTLADLQRSTDANDEKLRDSGENEEVRAQMYKDLLGVAKHNILDKEATLEIISYWCYDRNAEDVEFMTEALCELIHDGTTTPDHILSVLDEVDPKSIPKTVRTLMSKIEALRVMVSDDDEDEGTAKTPKKKHDVLKKKKRETPPPSSDDESYEVSRHKKRPKNDRKPAKPDPELLAIQQIKSPMMRAMAVVEYTLKSRATPQDARSASTKAHPTRHVVPKSNSNGRIKLIGTDDEEGDPAPEAKSMSLVVHGGSGGKPRRDIVSNWGDEWGSDLDDGEHSTELERVVPAPKGENSSALINSNALRSKIFELVHEATEKQRADILQIKHQQAEDRKLIKQHENSIRKFSGMDSKLDRLLELQERDSATSSGAARAGPLRPAPAPEDTSKRMDTEVLLSFKLDDFEFGKEYDEYYKTGKYVKCWEHLQVFKSHNMTYRNVLNAQEKVKPKGEVYDHWDKIKKLAQTMPPAPTGTAASAPRTAGSGASAARTAGSAGARTVGTGASAAKPADTPETATKAAAPVPTTGGTGGGAEIVVHGADEDNKFE
jgi:hypothetical protein